SGSNRLGAKAVEERGQKSFFDFCHVLKRPSAWLLELDIKKNGGDCTGAIDSGRAGKKAGFAFFP
ncbi:hypothetical protein, partial [Aliibacillus thermotolerans]|uniref:hypothetical protein n=1 Tax=Aliibacillus thermotolerans TaxID=1834418 RepID=UPI0022EA7F82